MDDPEVIECTDPERLSPSERDAARITREDLCFNREHYAMDYEDEGGQVAAALQHEPTWRRSWSMAGDTEALSESERERLQRLPRIELMVDDQRRELLSLVDILFGWAYDIRITDGEHTVESGWTIGTSPISYVFKCALNSFVSCLTQRTPTSGFQVD